MSYRLCLYPNEIQPSGGAAQAAHPQPRYTEREKEMTDIENLLFSLNTCAAELDRCAKMIRDSKVEPVKPNVQRIGYALTSIFEIQLEIYKTNPELKPEELKTIKPDGKNRTFGQLLLEVENLCEEGEPQVALRKLEAFIETGPGEMFEEMAKQQIVQIRERFDV